MKPINLDFKKPVELPSIEKHKIIRSATYTNLPKNIIRNLNDEFRVISKLARSYSRRSLLPTNVSLGKPKHRNVSQLESTTLKHKPRVSLIPEKSDVQKVKKFKRSGYYGNNFVVGILNCKLKDGFVLLSELIKEKKNFKELEKETLKEIPKNLSKRNNSHGNIMKTPNPILVKRNKYQNPKLNIRLDEINKKINAGCYVAE